MVFFFFFFDNLKQIPSYFSYSGLWFSTSKAVTTLRNHVGVLMPHVTHNIPEQKKKKDKITTGEHLCVQSELLSMHTLTHAVRIFE